MNNKRLTTLQQIAAAFTLLWIGTTEAEFTLASPFTDHAVLQRNQKVPVWGTDEPGAKVTVHFAAQSVTTQADSEGRWQASLAPLTASKKGESLAIQSSSGSKLKLKDIVVGEVWLCSGQSNMQMGWDRIPEMKSLAKKAKLIRTFEVKQTVALSEQEHLQGQWNKALPKSAVALSFAHHLQKEADVPVGVIVAAWGSSSLEAWMPRELTAVSPHFQTMMEEFDADVETQERIQSILKKDPWNKTEDIFLRRQTNILYNAMIHPLIPYACQGVVWYQGERNTQSMFPLKKSPWYMRHSGMLKYGETLQHWMRSYRQRWNDEELDFLVVMLPGYHKAPHSSIPHSHEHPLVHSWAWLRESQLQALELPHTAVVNTIDLGELTNVHPRDKAPIGQRLALLAAKNTLGKKIIANGPMLEAVTSEGKSLIVSFKNAGGLQTLDRKAPTAFWISNDSAEWFPADAVIKGRSITLSSEKITKPLYVRYAFSGKPTVNLVNGAHLPAYPFRTDSFEP